MGFLSNFDNFYSFYYTPTRTTYYDPVPTSPGSGKPTEVDLKKLEKHGKKQLANTLKSNSAKKDQAEKFLMASKMRKKK